MIDKVIAKLEESGYTGKKINYQELQKLHEVYLPEVNEGVFAEKILWLTKSCYCNMKNKGTKGIILKYETIVSKEEIEETKGKLIEAGYRGKAITYKELQELHKKYFPNVNEKIFAQKILELTYANYCNLKKKTQKARILKTMQSKTKEQIEEIREKLKVAGYEEKLITYQELQELHKAYLPEVEEKVFAYKVLCIPKGSYYNMVTIGQNCKILKKQAIVTKEQKEQIRDELKQAGYQRKSINYEELKSLHQKYLPKVQEKIFAQQVLGVNECTYYNMKYQNRNR